MADNGDLAPLAAAPPPAPPPPPGMGVPPPAADDNAHNKKTSSAVSEHLSTPRKSNSPALGPAAPPPLAHSKNKTETETPPSKPGPASRAVSPPKKEFGTMKATDTDRKPGSPPSTGGADKAGGRVSDKQTYSFGVHLLHQFPLVSKQVKNGLYCLKRTANYLQKVANAHEACANAIIAANQHEKTKVTFDEDAMKSYGEAYLQMQEVTIQAAQKQRALGAGIVEGVVKPLLEHFSQAEAKRLQINKDEERQSYLLSNAHEGGRLLFGSFFIASSTVRKVESWSLLHGRIYCVK